MHTPTKITHIRSNVSSLALPARGYRLGQQLMATVINGSTEKGSPANALIRIGNLTLQVRSTMDLSKGDVLKLQVMRLQPQTLLSMVAINGVKPSLKVDPLKSAVMQLQPRQGGLPELLGTLSTLVSNRSTGDLSAQLAPYLRQFFTSLIARHEISESAAMSQAFLNSGLFLEHKLLHRKNDPQFDKDLKASLLGLLNLLGKSGKRDTSASRPPRRAASDTVQPPHRDVQPIPQPRSSPGDLGSYSENQIQALLNDLIEAALSRLTLHQIASAENSREGELRWLTEIPINNGGQADVLHLSVARENHGAGDKTQVRWSAELALDLPALGPITARVSLYKGQISGTLWAERESTVERLNREIHQLEDGLAKRKLKVKSLACYAGKPVATARDREPLPLVDIQA